MTRATDAERRRLGETFVRLCRIASPSGQERGCADAVIAELAGLGIATEEDGAADTTGGNCGNVLARIPGTGEGALLLCAHLDTVPLAAEVEPVVVNDGWENANDGILGADNKAAVAVLLALAARLVTVPGSVGVELLFTVGEETGLAGAKAFEIGRLRSGYGYVFDHASPIGEIVAASPTYYSLDAELRGVAAHAGIRPQDGRSAIVAASRAIAAMRLGRLDEQTTANIGRIEGGNAANVVAERCRVVGEARSLDRQVAELTVTAMIDCLQDAANAPDCECDVDVTVARVFDGYRTSSNSAPFAVAAAALETCGYRPQRIVTGGGSDANALIASGYTCVNLANGTERNHQPDERVSVAALEGMLDVSLALVEQAAAAAC